MQIDFVGPGFLEGLYRAPIDALAVKGHKTNWVKEADAYLAGGSLRSADALIAIGTIRIGAREMDEAKSLRALISPVTGTEAFDEKAATERSILIANGQIEENYVSMAEATVMLILASLYDLNATQRHLRDNTQRSGRARAHMLKGKTVGLIGFGQIAQAVAARLQPFDCRLLASIQHARPLPPHVGKSDLDQLLTESDVVVVLTGLSPETRNMLGLQRLRQMKPGVVFVNVSRGGIAPDDDLAVLAGERPEMRLALDVFEPEPLRADSPLRAVPGAILTPHMVGHTAETHERLPVTLLENIENVLAGRVPDYVRNRAAIDGWLRRWGGVKS